MLNSVKVLELAQQQNYTYIIDLCKQDIKEQSAKNKGGNSELKRFKVASKMLEQAGKEKEKLKTAWIIGDEQYLSNGYIGFKLKNHIENLPTSETAGFDLAKCFPSDIYDYREVNIPSITEMKADVKISDSEYKVIHEQELKAKISVKEQTKELDIEGRKLVYIDGDIKWGCDKKLLITAIEILGGDITMKIPKNPVHTSILESENGKAIVLPVRI